MSAQNAAQDGAATAAYIGAQGGAATAACIGAQGGAATAAFIGTQGGAATAAYIGAQGGIMDNTDLKILSYLQKNGRASIKEISGQVNLSSPAVTERIKRLEESGVIDGYHADINYLKIGKTVQAFVTVDCDPKKYDTFCAFCENSPLIESHFHIIGPYNAMLHVAVSDSDELAELLGQIQLFGISQTSVILNTLFYRKENIDWGKHKK